MSATLKVDMAGFNRQLAELQRISGHTASGSVRYWGRIVLRKLAYKTAKATQRHKNRGRLRAGWWPAAEKLGVSTVYSGTYPNAGEGWVVDKTANPIKPFIIMANTVPYAPKGMEAALNAGMREVEARAKTEWEKYYKQHMSRWLK